CYATNSVDVGPYFCCPVCKFIPNLALDFSESEFLLEKLSGSTYGAAWRPATPFYNYVPPMPANWPDVMKVTANWPSAAIGLPVKARKPVSNQEETEETSQIGSSINDWLERQAAL
ncbi:unnamed protein product, partial [Cylicostephanus goldi]